MPNLGGTHYQIDRPLTTAGRAIWQTQLVLIFMPLLIIVGFCSVYIQIRIHQQVALSKATRQQQHMDQDVHDLPSLKLTTQSKLPVVQSKTSSTDSSSNTDTVNDQEATAPQSSNSNFSYLQSGYNFDDWSRQLSVGYSKNTYTLNTDDSKSHNPSHSDNSHKHSK